MCSDSMAMVSITPAVQEVSFQSTWSVLHFFSPNVDFFFLFFSRDLKHNLISTILPGAFQGLSELRKL